MDKLTKTLFLLILIAISIQTYLLNEESHSQEATALVVPISINVLLVLIYICNPDKLEYRNVIANVLIGWLIISSIWIMFFLYVVQLGKAFKN